MNKAIPLVNQVLNNKVLEILLFASLFFLPLSLFLNNLFFTIFFIGFNVRILLTEPVALFKSLKGNYLKILILCGPFILALIGCLYTENLDGAFKDLGRLFPLVFVVPLVFHQPNFFKPLLKRMIYILAFGCLISACICWGLSLVEIYENNNSVSDLFSQPYAYHFLSERVGIHTPYLGLFVAVSIFHLFLRILEMPNNRKRFFLVLWACVLFVFLLNLLARTAIFTLIVSLVILLLLRRRYVLLVIGAAILLALGSLAYFQDNNFLRDRIFKSVNIFEEQSVFSKKDDRFYRFSASIEVFKEFPFIGPGTASEDAYRKEIYFRNRDSKAFNENYNAHNQFLEYLSTFGLLGGMVFFLLLFILIREASLINDSFVIFLVIFFIFAGLTESILERSWGISFYILVIFLVYGSKNSKGEAH